MKHKSNNIEKNTQIKINYLKTLLKEQDIEIKRLRNLIDEYSLIIDFADSFKKWVKKSSNN